MELGLGRDNETKRKFAGLEQSYNSFHAPATGLVTFRLLLWITSSA